LEEFMAGKEKTNPILNGSQGIVQLVLVLLLIVAAFFIGMLWTKVQSLDSAGSANPVANLGDQPAPPPSGAPAEVGDVPEIQQNDWVKGNRNAKFALVEYSDYECPFCSRFHPTAQQMLEEYGDDVMWVFRHFPLESIHPSAKPLAIAAECAGKLGGNDAFWKFTDEVMTNGPTVDTSALAGTIGLNVSNFDSCISNEETIDLVEEDIQGGLSAGVTGTPGNILLNIETGEAELLPGAVPFSMVKTALDGMMQ
jgi:protein-disulfide isomerase